MPAPIVYEGFQGQQNGGGLLFEGLKFWVGYRVPQRNRWIDGIQQNGGSVVGLEKHADMLIADPSFPRTVPQKHESYSWKFVEDALSGGELPDKDDYLILRPGGTGPSGRPAGSGQPTKGTRNPFTGEDDRILTKWVRKARFNSKGNAIYQQLAEKHDRHTWQAWRDRWVRRLCLLPENANFLEQSEDDDEDVEHMNGSAQPPSAPPKSAPRKSATSSRQSPNTKRTRLNFTAEEDDRLLKMIQEARESARDISGMKIYQEFSWENPTHSAESWKGRYLRTLLPRIKRDASHNEGPSEPSPLRHAQQASQPPSSSPPAVSRGGYRIDLGTPQREERRPSPELDAAVEDPPPREPEVKQEEEVMGNGSPEAGPSRDDDLPDEGSANAEDRGEDSGSEASDDPDERQSADEDPETDEQKFLRQLSYFMEVNPDQVDLSPAINGQYIKLWDLFRVVNRQEAAGTEHIDWAMAAEELGLDKLTASTLEELAACYHRNLEDFVTSVRSFPGLESEEASDDDEDLEDADQPEDNRPDDLLPIPSANTVAASPTPVASSPSLPPLPPVPSAALKRRRDDLSPRRESLPGLTPLRKRPRFDRNVEIPATPEVPSRFSARPQRDSLAQEPETQDWRFDPATQDLQLEGEQEEEEMVVDEEDGEGQTQADITPSQQLHSESEQPDPHLLSDGSAARRLFQAHPSPPPRGTSMSTDWSKVPAEANHTRHTAGATRSPPRGMSEKALGKQREPPVSPPPLGRAEARRPAPPPLPPSYSIGPEPKRRTLPESFGQTFSSAPTSHQPRPPPSSIPQQMHIPGQRLPSALKGQRQSSRAPGDVPPPKLRASFVSPPAFSGSSRRPPAMSYQDGSAYTRSPAPLSSANGHNAQRRELVPNFDSTGLHTAKMDRVLPTSLSVQQHKKNEAPSSSRSKETANHPKSIGVTQELEKFMALGYPRDFITTLFHATALDIGLVNAVLFKLPPGEGGRSVDMSELRDIPRDTKGVWTPSDDEALAIVNGHDFTAKITSLADEDARRAAARHLRRLRRKHSDDGMLEARTKYLQKREKSLRRRSSGLR